MIGWIVVLVLLLALAVGVGFYLYQKSSQEEEKARKFENWYFEEKQKLDKLDELQHEVTRLTALKNTSQQWIDNFNDQMSTVSKEIEEKKIEYHNLEEACNETKELLEKQSAAISAHNEEKDNLVREIDSLKNSYRAALFASKREEEKLENGDQVGWSFNLEAHEANLSRILEGLMVTYPDLESDFASIAWKKIWLPKIQKLAGKYELDGKCGIYRLRLIEDESIAYVGQAVNIKERWYTHMKKMLGVEKKGNEKLYGLGYGPEKFIWEVVEEVEKDKLDEREKFWIDWWGCKEWGLNKK